MSSALEFEADFDRMLQNRIGPLIKVPEHSPKPVFQVLIGGTRFIPVNVKPGGVRHDPQRFMGKSVTVPHFSRDTVEFASRKRDKSNPGIKTLLPFLKNITEESDLENFRDLKVALDACYWLHKTISISLSRFRDDRAI